jgi:pimeloyl-ACP methyl ester carboxylesterase
MRHLTLYRTIQIDGLSIFYKQAGPKDAPTLLLLHGFPSSSRMFEPLFARLSDRYQLVAPDYPGFGGGDWPDPEQFAYTIDGYAEIMNHFTEALELSRYTLYMQDYSGPVGFCMALAHPERIEGFILQSAVAHNNDRWANQTRRPAFWADWDATKCTLPANLLSLPLLVISGKYDLAKPEAYRGDVPNAHVHVLGADHFGVDTAADEIALLVRGFIDSSH